MISDNTKWSEPFQWEDEDGELLWRRIRLIPTESVSSFFALWKANKYKMWDEGFSVKKLENEWYLMETKKSADDFTGFTKKQNVDIEPKKEEPKGEDFWLPPYTVKNITGLREWQINSVSKLVSSINKWGAAIDGSDVGTGKCHSKGTKIRMYDGSLKNVEDILVGDILMGDDSTPRNVLSLANGTDDMYEIVPTNGGISWGCNKEHILVLEYKARKQKKEISVKDFLKKYKSNRHNWTLKRAIANYPQKNVTVDPYLMGLWIGDGTWNSFSITTHKNDLPIIEYIYSYEMGYIPAARIYKSKDRAGSNCNTYYFRGIKHGKNKLWDNLKSYGFGINREKFIPTEYLINSISYRKLLLAGLIDSDGYKGQNGYYSITTKWKKLQQNISELAASLGYKVFMCEKIAKNNNFGMNGNTYYTVNISGANDLPVLLDRKKSTVRMQKKDVLNSGFKIVKKGVGEYFGFTLDGNNKYLLEDFTITHNTYAACGVARELNMKILVVCPKAVMESWKRVITNHFSMKDKLVDIINYEQLRIGKKDSDIASFVKNRKTHRDKFTWKISKDTLIVWDESQKLKNWKTKNSKTCIEAMKQGYKMLFCSATNATNPLELRTVGTVIQLFKGAKSYYQWCYEHGVSKGRYGMEFTADMTIRKRVLKKLNQDIFVDRGVRLSRDTIPNFPESELIAECYNMDDIDVKRINQCHAEMEIELKKLRAKIKKDKASELTAIIRARQQIELVKVPLFIDMIEDGIENGMSVVVFVNFTETLQSIATRLNITCIFDGKTSDEVRQQNVDNFQAGKERVILVNIASGGAGLSLHDIHGINPRLALISPSYSAVLMRQATGRVWRENAKSKSIQKILFVADTIEETVCKNVQEKLKNLDILNDGDLIYEKIYEIHT